MIFTRGILLLALACASLSLASAKINLRDADIKVFISDMAGVTNKTFVVDPRVKGSVTVASEIDLSIDEAYKILNLDRSKKITKEDVKKAHSKIQKKIHPDISPETSRLSAIVNEAKEIVLKDIT